MLASCYTVIFLNEKFASLPAANCPPPGGRGFFSVAVDYHLYLVPLRNLLSPFCFCSLDIPNPRACPQLLDPFTSWAAAQLPGRGESPHGRWATPRPTIAIASRFLHDTDGFGCYQ